MTWPAAPKLSVALFFGSMVPVADRLWLSVVRTTGTMLVTVPGEPLGRVRNQAAAAAPSSTTAATGSAIRGRRSSRRGAANRGWPDRVGVGDWAAHVEVTGAGHGRTTSSWQSILAPAAVPRYGPTPTTVVGIGLRDSDPPDMWVWVTANRGLSP